MRAVFEEYRARKMVNVHKHVDGPWFWDKYSASPYVGCRFGCEFCYLRGAGYSGRRDPASFDSTIRVKINAVELLRKELSRLTYRFHRDATCRESRGIELGLKLLQPFWEPFGQKR